MHKFRLTVAAGALAAAGFCIADGMAQTTEAPFTAAQAAAGRAAYATSCAGCHQANLAGSGEQPPLAGASFMASWGKRSAKDFYEDIRANMPYGRAGSLDTAAYQSITAFILSANGAKPGSKAFDGTSATLISSVASGQVPASIASAARRSSGDEGEGGGGRAPGDEAGPDLDRQDQELHARHRRDAGASRSERLADVSPQLSGLEP